jgi:hypothetical protein
MRHCLNLRGLGYVLAIIPAFAIGACTDAGTEPPGPADVANATYSLIAVNGVPLPYRVRPHALAPYVLEADNGGEFVEYSLLTGLVLRFRASDSVEVDMHVLQTPFAGGAPELVERTFVLPVDASGARVVIRFPPPFAWCENDCRDRPERGAVAGDSLVLQSTLLGVGTVYRRVAH